MWCDLTAVYMRVCLLLAGDVVWLTAAVQCSEDLRTTSSSQSSLSTTPVFYACGSRLFKCRAIFDANRSNNSVVSYAADELPSADSDAAIDRLPVGDRICPYCSQTIAGSVSQADYERHVQSHLDSDADDTDVTG